MEFRNLEDVRRILNDIRWDLTPQEVVVQTRKAFGNPEKYGEMFEKMRGYYFCISVWGCKAELTLVDHVQNFGDTYILETDIPDEILERAVFEQGGSMLISGLYAIDETIKKMIMDRVKKQARPRVKD